MDIDDDVSVEVADKRLVVSGERRSRSETKDEKSRDWLVREMRYGAFRREFALPDGLSADDVQASYKHGILTLRVRNVVKGPPKPVRVSIGKASATTAGRVRHREATRSEHDRARIKEWENRELRRANEIL